MWLIIASMKIQFLSLIALTTMLYAEPAEELLVQDEQEYLSSEQFTEMNLNKIELPIFEISETGPAALKIENEPTFDQAHKKYFSYFSLGTCGFALPFRPELSVGARKLGTHNAWDFQAGSSLMVQYFWAQSSYLYYFIPTTGSYSSPYLGVGLTVGYSKFYDFAASKRFNGYANIPFTMGYQWGEKKRDQFFQIQFTPFFITTLSYGVGF